MIRVVGKDSHVWHCVVMCCAQVSLGGVGKIYKIRLELLSQDVNSKPSWKVKTVSDCVLIVCTSLYTGPQTTNPSTP